MEINMIETSQIESPTIEILPVPSTAIEWDAIQWYPLQQDAKKYFTKQRIRTSYGFEWKSNYSPFGTIHIIGAGGVGFWLATALNPLVTNQIMVWDDDNFVGGTGHNRLPDTHEKTTLKVRRLESFMLMNFATTQDVGKVTYVNQRLFTCPTNVPAALVVDCSDMDWNSRKIIWDNVASKGIPIVRVSYDKDIITWSNKLPLGVDTRGGYDNVPTLANSFAAGGIGATLVAEYVHGNRIADKTIYVGDVRQVELRGLQTTEQYLEAVQEQVTTEIVESESAVLFEQLGLGDEDVEGELEGLFDEAGELIGYVDEEGVEVMFDIDSTESMEELVEQLDETDEFVIVEDDDDDDYALLEPNSTSITFEQLANSPIVQVAVTTISRQISEHLAGTSRNDFPIAI